MLLFGVVNYLNYQFDEKWIGNARLEFFSDPQAQRTGFDGTYTAVTAGVIYKPLPGCGFAPKCGSITTTRGRSRGTRRCSRPRSMSWCDGESEVIAR